MQIVAYIVLALVALILLMQFAVKVRMRRLQGKPLPAIDGEVGEVLQRHDRALIYFFSPTCGACRAMTPIVDRLASQYGNVVKVDVSQSLEVARRFGVMATPTTVLAEGGQVVKVLVGAQSDKQLESLLE